MNVVNKPAAPNLPWVEGSEDRLFKGLVAVLLILFLALGIIMNSVILPEMQQKKLSDISPRLAKLILEKKKTPPPPPPKEKKVEKEKPKAKKKKPEKPKAKPKPDSRTAARKKAQKSGLIALQDELSDLRESFDFTDIGNLPQQKTGNLAQVPMVTSDVLSAKAKQGRGGIKTDTLNRQLKGSELAQRKTTRVKSNIKSSKKTISKSPTKNSRSATRDQDEIERVFQKNKGAISNIYNRELRKDPSLLGKVVVELTISPEGKVLKCFIVSSELGHEKLEKRLISQIKKFRFANKKVPTVTITYPIDFLPS